MIKFFRKYHKWLGIILTLFLVLFALSGIVLNHRQLFSGIDVSRSILPKDYKYEKWNNASVRGSVAINNDSVLVYGNVGAWLTNVTFNQFSDFNKGFPNGVDNRKISKIFKDSQGDLFAGTLFGLYQYNFSENYWVLLPLPGHEKRVVDIAEKGDSLIVLTRSHVYQTTNKLDFREVQLVPPAGYDNKTGLFKTLWVIHSGEIYGLVGKIIVDLVGVIFIFLSVTGFIFFINRYRIKRFKRKKKSAEKLKNSSRWNLKWHNKIGWTTLLLLLITTLTGMFLRPPLLIAIARTKVNKIPFSMLDSPNPWFDKLRAVQYDSGSNTFILSTSDGFYAVNERLDKAPVRFNVQPPVSVMGINVFERIASDTYLVGSFSGIFEWQLNTGKIIDRVTGQPYVQVDRPGPPIGSNVIAGYSKHFKGAEVIFDYGSGAFILEKGKYFVDMPDVLQDSPMSLWNLALEVHTARIYQFLFGNFYILIIPLSGLFTLFILISGFIVWYKRHRKKKPSRNTLIHKKVVK